MEIMELLRRFDTEDKCVVHLASVRLPDGPVCYHCGARGDAQKAARPCYWRCGR